MARKTTERKSVEFHGETRKDGHRSAEYTCWVQLIQRCINPDAMYYHRYGGRGIKVCKRWQNSFVAFLKDMGRKPSPLPSIERKNNNGNYEPGNCVWTIIRAQTRNRSTNNNITAFGETFCVTDWAEALGAEPSAITSRIERGWSAEDAVSIAPERYEQRFFELRGKVMNLSSWAKEGGTAPMTAAHRIKMGWSLEDAFFGKPGLQLGTRTRDQSNDYRRATEAWLVGN